MNGISKPFTWDAGGLLADGRTARNIAVRLGVQLGRIRRIGLRMLAHGSGYLNVVFEEQIPRLVAK